MNAELLRNAGRIASATLLLGGLAACGGNKTETPSFNSPSSIVLDADVKPSQALIDYIDTLPRQYGNITWTGEWVTARTDTGAANIRTQFDENGLLRKSIDIILVPTAMNNNPLTPLTIEQQKAIAKKESFGHMCSHEYINTQIIPNLTEEQRYSFGNEIVILADGLAVFALTSEEQDTIGTGYTDPKYNYNSDGTPRFPDFNNQSEGVIKGPIEWDCQRPITPDMIAAVHIMSSGQKIINQGGIKNLGQILIENYYNNFEQ